MWLTMGLMSFHKGSSHADFLFIQLSHFTANNHSNATSPAFLCAELPVRYMHMLRLLSSLPLDALQSPMIKHVSHRYLHDLCTLLHPSMQNTSSRAFSDVMRRLRQRQATSLIRLRYALAGSAMLMDNINTIGLGIQFLTGNLFHAYLFPLWLLRYPYRFLSLPPFYVFLGILPLGT